MDPSRSEQLRAVGASAGPEDLLDASVIDEIRRELGESTLQEVVDAFLAGSCDFVSGLRAALAHGDRGDATARLHRMVGSAAAVGATSLAEACRRSERGLLDAGAGETVKALDVEPVERLLENTRDALRGCVQAPVPAAD